MGKNKNLALLKSGAINQEEYNRRINQAKTSKKARGEVSNKQLRKEVSRSLPAGAVRNDKSIRKNFQKDLAKQQLTPGSVDLPGGNMITRYLNTLLNPAENMCRYPDSNDRETGIFRSVATYFVPIRFGTSGTGRFSMCAQPILGSTASITQYQLGMVNLDSNLWDTANWTDPLTYSGPIGGCDPRVDVNKAFLTAELPGYWQERSMSQLVAPQTSAVTGDNLFSTPGDPKNSVTLSPINYLLEPRHSSTNNIVLPIGTYYVNVIQQINTALGAIWGIGSLSTSTVTIDTSNAAYNLGNTQDETSGAGLANVSWSAIVTSRRGFQQLVLRTYRGTITTPAGAGEVISIETWVSISDVSTLADSPTSSGVIEELRPVAQSLLCTYMGPELLDGGTIAISYVPKDYVLSNYYTTSLNSYGQGQYVEDLMKTQGAMNFRLDVGAYGWWSPFDSTDMSFKSVSDSLLQDYPALICSGQFVPVSAIPAGGSDYVLRVQLVTVFEFVTKCTAFEVEKFIGCQAMIDAVFMMLSQQSHVMANGNHLAFIKDMAREAIQWIKNNPQFLVKMGKLAAPIALKALGAAGLLI